MILVIVGSIVSVVTILYIVYQCNKYSTNKYNVNNDGYNLLSKNPPPYSWN